MTIQIIPYQIRFDHDGRKYDVELSQFTVPKCTNCGELSIDTAADEQVDRAFRQQASLLHPEEIKRGRQDQLGLTLPELADYLGATPEQVERCENGWQIQPRLPDDLLRALFALPELCAFLKRLHGARAETPARSA